MEKYKEHSSNNFAAQTAPMYALQVKQMLDGRRFRGAEELLKNQ